METVTQTIMLSQYFDGIGFIVINRMTRKNQKELSTIILLMEYVEKIFKATLFLFYVLQDFCFKLSTIGRKKEEKK